MTVLVMFGALWVMPIAMILATPVSGVRKGWMAVVVVAAAVFVTAVGAAAGALAGALALMLAGALALVFPGQALTVSDHP